MNYKNQWMILAMFSRHFVFYYPSQIATFSIRCIKYKRPYIPPLYLYNIIL